MAIRKCICGTNHNNFYDWYESKCCLFSMVNWKDEDTNGLSIFYVRSGENSYYEINNQDNEILIVETYQYSLYAAKLKKIKNIPLITESDSVTEMEQICLNFIKNICFL